MVTLLHRALNRGPTRPTTVHHGQRALIYHVPMLVRSTGWAGGGGEVMGQLRGWCSMHGDRAHIGGHIQRKKCKGGARG